MRITRREWGGIGESPVWLYDIEGPGLTASVSNYGGVLQSLRVPVDGEMLDVVLGYDDLAAYLASDTCFGAMIGPIADRLDRGRCELGGQVVQMPLNAGPDSMHCGDRGFHRMLWNAEELPDGLCLRRSIPPEESGYPGALRVELRYRFPGEGVLRLEYAAESDGEAAVSFTNHSYFTLNGASSDCRGHLLTLPASRYAGTAREVEPICTGDTLPVDGTPLDLRGGARIGDAVDRTDFREIAVAGGVDHYFPVDGEGFREMARVCNPENGLELVCRSDAPGLLVYTANGLVAEPGKGGLIYGRNWAVCLETERFPNAVNHPRWRDQVLLKPGEVYRSATTFSFRRHA